MDATGAAKKDANKEVNKHLLSLFPLAVLVAVTQAGGTTQDVPFQFPSFPYSQVLSRSEIFVPSSRFSVCSSLLLLCHYATMKLCHYAN